MTLRDLMARHAREELVREDHHGEQVTYHFAAGGERTILAVVDRLQLEPIRSGRGGGAVRTATLFIARHATLGVEAIAEGDEITCVLELGQPAVRCSIAEPLDADEGGFLVRVAA